MAQSVNARWVACCADIDECKLKTYKCDGGKSCINKLGSYECGVCGEGFTAGGSGTNGAGNLLGSLGGLLGGFNVGSVVQKTSSATKCTGAYY